MKKTDEQWYQEIIQKLDLDVQVGNRNPASLTYRHTDWLIKQYEHKKQLQEKTGELHLFLQEIKGDGWGSHVIDAAIQTIKSLKDELTALEHEREDWELAMNNLKDSYRELESALVVDMTFSEESYKG